MGGSIPELEGLWLPAVLVSLPVSYSSLGVRSTRGTASVSARQEVGGLRKRVTEKQGTALESSWPLRGAEGRAVVS